MASTWTSTCIDHCYTYDTATYNSQTFKIPELRGSTVENALQEYMDGKINKLMNPLPWPSNFPCSGIESIIE